MRAPMKLLAVIAARPQTWIEIRCAMARLYPRILPDAVGAMLAMLRNAGLVECRKVRWMIRTQGRKL